MQGLDRFLPPSVFCDIKPIIPSDFAESAYLDAQPKYKYDIYSELAQSTFSKSDTEGVTPNTVIIDVNSLDSLKYYI